MVFRCCRLRGVRRLRCPSPPAPLPGERGVCLSDRIPLPIILTPIMDPLYRPFFQHVWPICWPWLWWNLVRLTAWRMRTGRQIFILVDRFGNIYTRFIGDAPKPAGAYSYEAPEVPRWERMGVRPLLPGACEGWRTHSVRPSKGLGMRGRGVAARTEPAETTWPLTPALARAIAMRLLVLASPRERGLSASPPRGPP